MRWLIALFIIGTTVLPLSAEDWTTVDGKTYQDVNVVKVEDDGINISYTGGTAKIPYYNLPLEIQKQYGQDPDTVAAARKAAEAAEANRQLADEETKKQAEDLKRQQADDQLQIKALAAAKKANPIILSEADLRVPSRETYTGADYSYNKFSDTSYLDSLPAIAVPMPTPAANDPMAGHASLMLRAVTVGPRPEQPDKFLAAFLSTGVARKLTDDVQVIFLVDGITMPISESEMKDSDFITGYGQIVDYVSFYLTPKQVDAIVNAKSVKFCVGTSNYSLNKDELGKLKTYASILDKSVPPATSILAQKFHLFIMSIPPLPILISDICIYILTGSFTIVVLLGITSCFVGASRFFKM